MESKQTSPFVERPIILSPPPLNNPNIINNYHNRRNQSVGYNLQHEFETLSADLDLDLKDDIKVNQPSVTVPNSSLPTNPLSSINANLNSVSAPATASVPNLTNQPQSQFINTISPTPTNVNVSQAGLDSLLNQNFLPSLNLPIRPQSVNDFNLFPSNNGNTNNGGNINGSNVNPTNPMTNQDQSNFYMELMRFTNWIENLNGQEHSLMIDYLCGNLSIDILMNFKTKLDQNLSGSQLPNFYQQQLQHLLQQQQTQHSNLRQQSHHNQGFLGIGSPYEYTQSDVIDNFDNLNLNDNVLHQPKPRDKNILNGNNYQNTVLSNFNNNLPGSRPRSAEPTMIQNHKNTHYLDRAKSPTNHLYEKTNFLQLAAARSPGLNPHDESLDMSQKLGALATINSRVALDSNKKHHLHGNHYYDPTGRSVNSSSVPLSNSGNIIGNNTSNNNKSGIKSPNFKQQAQNITNRKNTSSPLTVRSNGNNTNGNSSGTENSQSNSSMPADVTNLELLNNIPAWLKLLRLHKYTECLKEAHWKQLIELDDQALEDKGVKALGARRKLLKAFDVIKTSSV